MKTSSRNSFHGKVTAIRAGVINDEIELLLDNGDTVCALITRTATEKLKLTVGSEALAIVKATEIMLAAETEDYLFSCKNQFSGKVVKLVRGFVNGEVLLQTASGLELNATITLEGVNRLKLERGTPVVALFKTANVLLAVKKPQ
jgi:molybdate transport system regulatory protein